MGRARVRVRVWIQNKGTRDVKVTSLHFSQAIDLVKTNILTPIKAQKGIARVNGG